MEPSEARVALLKEIRGIFAEDGVVPDVSKWGDAEFNGIQRSLSEYENKLMQNELSESEKAVNHFYLPYIYQTSNYLALLIQCENRRPKMASVLQLIVLRLLIVNYHWPTEI